MSDSPPRWNSLLDGPVMGRVGDALASPIGVLVLIPLLVVGVGLFMAAVGQRSVQGSIDTLAEARFTDQTQQAVRHTSETLGQAGPLMEAWNGFLDEQGGAPTPGAAAPFLRVLMQDRGGLSFVSFATPTGDLIGAYRDDAGDLFLSDRRLDESGRCLLQDHRIPLTGPIEPTRTDDDCGYDARSRPFYRQAVRAGGMTWTEPYVFYDSGIPGVTCSAPYHDADGNFRGVMAVDFNLNDLSDYIAELDTMPEGRIFAFTGDRILIAMQGSREGFARDRRGEGELLTPESLADAGLTAYFASLPSLDGVGPEPALFAYELDGTVMASVTACPLAGDLTWYVGALAPRSAFMAPAVAHRQTAVRVAAVALAVALALAGLFAVHLVRSRRAAALARAAARAARREVKELGSYRLVRKLGEGGMGEVWLAEHQLLARPAAVKLLHGNQLGDLPRKDLRDRLADFEREAQATATLSSASTVRLFDFGVSRDGLLFYVMELLEGIDLDQIVRQFGPLNPARVIHLLSQVCSSLAEAHDKGMVHRDIKPSNVFCCILGDEFDMAKVTDFGLVHVREARTSEGERSDTVAGTPAYMSPEHCMGQVDLDGRSDLYALGCVGYWLLTGRNVFDRTEPKDMMRQHVTARPIPPSEAAPLPVPPELDRVILRCLNKKPDRRFADARELRDALDAVPIPENQRWDRGRRRAWWARYGETVRGLQTGEPSTSPTPIRLERGPTQLMSSTDFESITLDAQTVTKVDPVE